MECDGVGWPGGGGRVRVVGRRSRGGWVRREILPLYTHTKPEDKE